MLVSIWEYRVAAGRQQDFEHAYGADGAWAALMRRARGYIGTELIQDSRDPERYLTLDCWSSADDRDAFRRDFAAPYQDLEAQTSALTTQESHAGDFTMEGALAWVAHDASRSDARLQN